MAGIRVVPRRSRCTGCRATHVLLPVLLLFRRADTVAVVGGGAGGRRPPVVGTDRFAELLGRPAATVRGWLRRFAARIEQVRAVFTLHARALAPDPVLPGPAGSGWADAVAAVAAAARALSARFAVEAPVWQVVCAVSGGRLLAPGWPCGCREPCHRL